MKLAIFATLATSAAAFSVSPQKVSTEFRGLLLQMDGN